MQTAIGVKATDINFIKVIKHRIVKGKSSVVKHCSRWSRDAAGSPSLEILTTPVRGGFGNGLIEISLITSKGLDCVTTMNPFILKLQ